MVSSAGSEFIDLAATAGLILDPFQCYILNQGLGERADGRWASFKNSIWVPRQNGKGGAIQALELGWLFLTREELIMHSAHEYKTAEEGYRRIRELVENTPDLDRHVHKYWQANGEQGIELRKSAGGGRLKFIARSRGSGRGFSGDKNILDEAQEITPAQIAALMPTMSARPDPQLWFFGTPPESPDAWCYNLREDGESGADPRLMHLDWGTDLDPTDPEHRRRAAQDVDLWYACNPALGGRITEEFVRGESLPSGLGERFMIERLGAWLPRLTEGGGVIDPAVWDALADEESQLVGDVAFALDVTPSRDWASIAAYGLRADGTGHLEVIDRRPGTEWIVDRLVQLADRWDPVAIALDAKGPAGSLLVDLDKAGIGRPEDVERPARGDLAVPAAPDVAAACGQLVDAITQRTVRHTAQPEVAEAIRGAKTRPLGDAWAWGRRISTVDISPLVAVTLARWAWETRTHLVEDADYDVLDSVL